MDTSPINLTQWSLTLMAQIYNKYFKIVHITLNLNILIYKNSVITMNSLGYVDFFGHSTDDTPIHVALAGHRIRRCQRDVGRFLQERYLQMELFRHPLGRGVRISRPNDVLDVQPFLLPRLPDSDLTEEKIWSIIKVHWCRNYIIFIDHVLWHNLKLFRLKITKVRLKLSLNYLFQLTLNDIDIHSYKYIRYKNIYLIIILTKRHSRRKYFRI